MGPLDPSGPPHCRICSNYAADLASDKPVLIGSFCLQVSIY